MKHLLWVFGLLVLGACTEENPAYMPNPQLPGECRSGEEFVEVFDDFERARLYDILFVIDNSGENEDLQETLRDAVPDFLERFDAAGKNVRVGVTTTDPGGAALAQPGTSAEGCAGNNNRTPQSREQERWKEIAACNVVLEPSDDRQDVIFTTIQKVVAAGDDFELWRPDSRKLIVVVTRDDDCSTSDPIEGDRPREACAESDDLISTSSFTEFVRAHPETPEGLTVAFLAGPSSDVGSGRPVCNSRTGAVYAGNRIDDAVAQLGTQGISKNVCSEDLSSPLQSIADTVLSHAATLCASRPMAHEPLRVVGTVGDDESELRLGSGGFVYLGAQPGCDNGVLEIEDDETEQIEVTYCAL